MKLSQPEKCQQVVLADGSTGQVVTANIVSGSHGWVKACSLHHGWEKACSPTPPKKKKSRGHEELLQIGFINLNWGIVTSLNN